MKTDFLVLHTELHLRGPRAQTVITTLSINNMQYLKNVDNGTNVGKLLIE